MAKATTAKVPRPWIDHYPEGITWDVPINTTPVFEQLLATCARTPDADALDFLGRKTKFGELANAINAFAGALQSQFAIRKGTRVALLLPNTPFYVIAYYAVLRAGGTVVNCNPLYTVHELSHITANSGAEVMVTLDLAMLFDKAQALVAEGRVERRLEYPLTDEVPAARPDGCSRHPATWSSARESCSPTMVRRLWRVVRGQSAAAPAAAHPSLPAHPRSAASP